MEDGVVNNGIHKTPEPSVTLGQLLSGAFPLCDIACDFCESQERTFLVSHGIHYREGPEACPILANPPTLSLEPPSMRSRVKDSSWEAAFLILGREECRVRLANYFASFKALQPRGTRIPGDYPSGRTDQINGEIDGAVDQELKLRGVVQLLDLGRFQLTPVAAAKTLHNADTPFEVPPSPPFLGKVIFTSRLPAYA